ncbi:uncharacterized protein MCAP_0864 isoform X5 [Magallana gigas]|uniref:uncharacterized protein MCAP_0864 isoform X5 n=1 Tax=Magallana gigas TaxID=29159 RepID=UPI00333F955C
MSGCGGERIRSDRHRCLKDLQAGFRKLKQREKNNNYSADDIVCQETAKKLITDLRELTDSGSDEVLKFGVTDRGIVNRLERELKSSNEAYQKKANELDTEKTNHKKSKDRLEKELQKREDEMKLMKSEHEENENAKRILEKDNRILEAENKKLTDQMESLKSELQDVNVTKEKLETEYKRLNETTKKQRDEDIDEIQSLNAQLGQLEGERGKLETEKNRLNETAQKQREKDIAEIKSLNAALGQLEDEREKLETEKNRLKKESEQLKITLRDADKTQGRQIIAINDRDREINRLGTQIHKIQQECNQAKSSIQMHRNTIDKLQKNLTEEKKAKEHALNRLSAAAAHRLRDQNPGITDLSDPNRPLKLAEKVSELYDNEWTNAMENLESLNITEEKGIMILLKIIKNVFVSCVDFGDTHLESFPDLLVLPPAIYQLQQERVLSVKDMSSEMLKPMKDFRKSNAEHAISRLQKYFAAQRKLKIKQKVYDSCKEYIEKCVELCWMMRIQDPPIYMEADYQANSAFDSNKMRSYTKAGKFVHFVVWPTFFLHKDGPLLAKGVVQGSKSEVPEEESSSSSADDTDDDEKYKMAPTVSSDDNENRTDDVLDGKQSDSGNGKLSNDNITTIDTECLETKDKEKDDKSPAGNQSDQGNGDQPTDKSNTTIESNSSETDDNGGNGNVSQVIKSNPEKKNKPNDNSDTSYGSKSEENGDN